MTAVFVLRLVADALAQGRIAGQVEVVADGRITTCTCADDLMGALLAAALPSPPGGPMGPSATIDLMEENP